MTARIVIVVARADNGVIGKDGSLPWRLPADLRHFRELTSGTAMIMGRRTFDSLPGVLAGRRHIVVTRDRSWAAEGAEVVHSADEALAAAGDDPVTVIGGAEIIALFLTHADAVELTEVRMDADGDTFLPAFDPAAWREVSREDYPAEGDRPPFSFVRLERS